MISVAARVVSQMISPEHFWKFLTGGVVLLLLLWSQWILPVPPEDLLELESLEIEICELT